MQAMIDLRSDTATKPTEAMRAAMAAAEVGDEQLREDPTVNALQDHAAALLGQDAALFIPTATMANQIALKVLTRPGGQLLAEERTHILIFEAGGPAVHSGLVMQGLPGVAGRILPEQIRAVAAGRPAADYGRLADTVTVCFSKGLGCPLGAILAGSRERIEEAWRGKFLFGGALRQAGIVAAARLPVNVDTVDTNFIGLDVGSLGLSVREAQELIAREGVLVGGLRPGVVRIATYLGVTDDDVEAAIDAIPRALQEHIANGRSATATA